MNNQLILLLVLANNNDIVFAETLNLLDILVEVGVLCYFTLLVKLDNTIGACIDPEQGTLIIVRTTGGEMAFMNRLLVGLDK